MRILLIGNDKNSDTIEDFLETAKCKPIDASGKTNILQLVALIKKCNLLITSDSAPMHIAAAVGTPFCALFGPTDPERHVPASRKKIIMKKDFPCVPCYHTHCDRGYICMESIKPDEVLDKVLELLNVKKKKVKI